MYRWKLATFQSTKHLYHKDAFQDTFCSLNMDAKDCTWLAVVVLNQTNEEIHLLEYEEFTWKNYFTQEEDKGMNYYNKKKGVSLLENVIL